MKYVSSLPVVCFVFSACVATDVGNPQTDAGTPPEEATAEIRIEGFDEENPAALTLDDGVEITHAWIALDELQFEACDMETDDETDDETDVETDDSVGPVVTDLLSGTSLPGPVRLQEQMSNFCEFEARIRPLDATELPAGVPADLAGHSIVVRGLRKDGNPFVVYAELDETFELEGDIVLSTEAVSSFILGFALNGWVLQRDLGALEGNPIRITPDENEDVYERFVEAVASSARLFLDDGRTTLIAD